MSFREFIFLCALLYIIVPECFAAPIEIQEAIEGQSSNQINKTKTYTILKTIVLGYFTHIMTIRPSPDTDQKNTLFWRIAFFVYPTMGIGTATTAILSACESDKILGIDIFQDFFAKRKEDALKKRGKGGMSWIAVFLSDIWDSIKCVFLQLLGALSIRTYTPNEKEPDKDPAEFQKEVDNLTEEIIEFEQANGRTLPREPDNVACLAAVLLVLKPRQARRVKHCILNSSLYLGFDLKDEEIETDKDKLICTEDMTITGSGSIHKYQAGVKPHSARYLTPTMLKQLQSAHYLDNTSYMGMCITFGQLAYTIIECVDADGDKWAKVIMIIYMIMSVLQTTSLWILHKQIAAFSIYYDKPINYEGSENYDKPINYRGSEDYDKQKDEDDIIINPMGDSSSLFEQIMPRLNDILYENSFLDKIVKQEALYPDNGYKTFTEHKYWAYMLSGFGGLTVSLLVGIWADYKAHSTTQWIVLAWILSPLLLIILTILQKVTITEKGILYSLSVYFIYLIGIAGAACVLAATVEGYSIKTE